MTLENPKTGATFIQSELKTFIHIIYLEFIPLVIIKL